MVRFQTKNPNLGKFWRVLQWKLMVYFMENGHFKVFCYILRTFGIVLGNLENFPPFWYFGKNLSTLEGSALIGSLGSISHMR
jgi:hypothetical protein